MTTTATAVPAPSRAATHKWALPVLLAGTAMIVLDFFVVNVALPSIQTGLHAGASALEWVVAGYGLSFAALMVTAGQLGDRYGRRRTFVAGLVLFGATSAVCGLAPDPAVLVVARVLQGAAGALISPTVLALIGVMYPGPERVRAITAYGMAMGGAAAGGQLVGGLLLQADPAGLGWRTIFLINVPIALVAAIATPHCLTESQAESRGRLDVWGVALVTAALVALVLPLVQGQQLGWPAWTWISLASTPILLVAFGLHQRAVECRGGTPVLPPSLFAARSLRRGLVTQLAFWGGQAALFLVLALYLQEGRALDPLDAGLVFTILAVAYLAASLRAPTLTARFGRDLVGLGAILLSAGDAGMAIAVGAGGVKCPLVALLPGLLAAGTGMGLCITPLTTVVLAHADPNRAGALSAALSTMQQVGNSVGVAVTGVIFFGAEHHGIGRAFVLSGLQLSVLLLGVAGLTRLLPSRSAEVTG